MSRYCNLIQQVRNSTNTVMVPQNEVRFVTWSSSSGTRVLATEGLNGCTGVGIVSKYAAILGHIAPLPNAYSTRYSNDPGKQNLIALLQTIINMYQGNRHMFNIADCYVVIAIYEGQVALPEHLQYTRGVLRRLGVRIVFKTYNVLSRSTERMPGETSIVIVSNGYGGMPSTYVNDARI